MDYRQGNEMARRQWLVLCCRLLPDELGGLFVGHLRVIHYLALMVERLMRNTPFFPALRGC